jgi:hypothetical protein
MIITLQWLNPDEPEHLRFLGELLVACGGGLFDAATDDPILTVCMLEQDVRMGRSVCALALVDGRPVGALWAEAKAHEVFNLYGGMMPWNGLRSPALPILKAFCTLLFEYQGAHKLTAEVACWNRKAERLMRHVGFKKEGLLRDAVEHHGKRENAVLLGYLRNEFEVLNGKGSETACAA